ncbi:MAG TPA: alpha/beta fold hydrolase [Anaerolineaceae bacterium]|nr:alpha/beta fold hydrolase [Anaerolineaceae bacterium]
MQTENDTSLLEIKGFTVRVRPPQIVQPARLTLLIHGLTGDEDVMWVFTNRLSQSDWFVAPRAPYAYSKGGYTWVDNPQGIDTPLDVYLPMADRLLEMVDSLPLVPEPDRRRLRLLGFSQGAAMALAFTLAHPERVERVAALAGFLPPHAEPWLTNPNIPGIPVFMAHGTRDEQIPFVRARQSAEQMRRAGMQVTLCEDEVGHKLSLNCLKGMNQFFQS